MDLKSPDRTHIAAVFLKAAFIEAGAEMLVPSVQTRHSDLRRTPIVIGKKTADGDLIDI